MSEVKYKICLKCGAKMYRVPTGWTCPHCGYYEPDSTLNQPKMTREEALKILREDADWDWEKFRREAAKDILCVLIGNYQNNSFGQRTTISLCEEAIGKADELIKQLKEVENLTK